MRNVAGACRYRCDLGLKHRIRLPRRRAAAADHRNRATSMPAAGCKWSNLDADAWVQIALLADKMMENALCTATPERCNGHTIATCTSPDGNQPAIRPLSFGTRGRVTTSGPPTDLFPTGGHGSSPTGTSELRAAQTLRDYTAPPPQDSPIELDPRHSQDVTRHMAAAPPNHRLVWLLFGGILLEAVLCQRQCRYWRPRHLSVVRGRSLLESPHVRN